MELFSFHVQLLRLRASGSVDWDPDEEEREEPAPPMGFGSPVEVPEVEDGEDLEDRRLGFVLPP